MAYASRLYPRAEPRGFMLQRIKVFFTLALSKIKVCLSKNY